MKVYRKLSRLTNNIEIMVDEKLENFRSEIMNGIDKVLGELQNMREDMLIVGHHVNDHEERITRLEKQKSPII